MTPEQTLDWLAEQHKSQCNEDRPVQKWIRSMKSMLPAPVQSAERVEPVAWVGLTDEQIKQIYTEQTGSFIDDSPWALLDFARAIEAAHGIKENT